MKELFVLLAIFMVASCEEYGKDYGYEPDGDYRCSEDQLKKVAYFNDVCESQEAHGEHCHELAVKNYCQPITPITPR